MTTDLDSLPLLTARQAYLAMREFIAEEFELAGSDKTVHLGGLLAEMEPEADGTTSDPGAGITFAEAIQTVCPQTTVPLGPGFRTGPNNSFKPNPLRGSA